MVKRVKASLALVLFAATAHAAPVDDTVIVGGGREAFAQPLSGLDADARERFFRGRALFRQNWVAGPAQDSAVGLGPLYNRLACISCHPKNGRGRAPEHERQRMQSMLVRLSVPGAGAHGGPRPHPVYGDQFNEEGVPGVPGEGVVGLRWELSSARLADGTEVALRRPVPVFHELNYGRLDAPVMMSLRVGPPVFGLGLLDAVDAAVLERRAAAAKPDGIRGRVNRVWNAEARAAQAGRFGAKANVSTLRLQIADAMAGDLGLTSAIHPQPNCTPTQQQCAEMAQGGAHPELDEARLSDLEFYLAHVAVPARRDVDDPAVQRGERLFTANGCAHCHQPTLTTAANARFPRLANRSIHPYSDLLLHDMGEGLADNRPDFLASGREWRTPPLWGIGLVETINEYRSYLHDGRARTLTEAVMWHGGEAAVARERFAALPFGDREALLRFLESL